MAKAEKAEKTEVAKTDDITDIAAYAEQYAGQGQSDREEDKIQSWVKVLQQLSPELDRNQPTYVDDAKAGDIWITGQNILIPGDVGFDFQPCGYIYNWVEWSGPIGTSGRPVNRYFEQPTHLGGENPVWGKMVLPNGHEIIETRYHMGLVFTDDGRAPFPATISYSSTGSNESKSWLQRMRAHKLPSGASAPIFMYRWRMITRSQSNDRGQRWYLLTPKAQGERAVNKAQMDAGAEIFKRIEAQSLKLGEESAVNTQVDQIPF